MKMKIDCPQCREKATLILALMEKNDQFGNSRNEWRRECPACGMIQEGRFPFLWKLLLSALFLGPAAAAWALFLLYDESIKNSWLTLFLFLGHFVAGLSAGYFLSERIAGRLLSQRSDSFR